MLLQFGGGLMFGEQANHKRLAEKVWQVNNFAHFGLKGCNT